MIAAEDSSAGAPPWVMTFGDMMALLLTFFILLVSMSELKKDDKYQGVADSLEEHFGGASAHSEFHGDNKPRDGALAALVNVGRAKRKSWLENNVREPDVDPKVRLVRPGERTTIGAVIFFADADVELTAEGRRTLLAVKDRLAGKPQKIEVRGRSSRQPSDGDPWDLAYQRSRATIQFLIEELKIEPERVRLSVAEPTVSPAAAVEVFLLEETVDYAEAVLQPPGA